MKQLGAIAALRDSVAFNTEVADELRAVFDDFRSTAYGQGFEVETIENFKTDEFGESTFAMHNKPSEPEFSLQVEIHSSGVAEVYTKSAERAVALNPWIENQSGSSLLADGDRVADLAAARVIGKILEMDQSSCFGKNFRKYVSDHLAGREPQAAPRLDFPSSDLG